MDFTKAILSFTLLSYSLILLYPLSEDKPSLLSSLLLLSTLLPLHLLFSLSSLTQSYPLLFNLAPLPFLPILLSTTLSLSKPLFLLSVVTFLLYFSVLWPIYSHVNGLKVTEEVQISMLGRL
jgi:hypothetical protein